MFDDKHNKKYIEMLLKDNERLEKENKELKNKISQLKSSKAETSNLRDRYNELVNQSEFINKEYMKKLKDINDLESEYRKALNDLINNEKIKKSK